VLDGDDAAGAEDPRLVVDETKEGSVPFSVVESAGGTPIGTATLWGIDHHNRSAHIGSGLLPSSRGKDYGTDVVAMPRSSAWVMGEFLDEVLLGLLAQDWRRDSKGWAAARRSRARAGTAAARTRAGGRRSTTAWWA